MNHFGEDVDQGLLLRFPEDQRLWVGEGGDLAILVAQKWSSPWLWVGLVSPLIPTLTR
jgi:hypothetical protein